MKLPTITGTIGAQLCIEDPPKRLVRSLKLACTFTNPVYEDTLKFSPYANVAASIPPTIELFEHKGNTISVPRGFHVDDLERASRMIWRRILWKDRRVSAPTEFPAFQIALNKEQKYLVKGFIELINSKRVPFGAAVFASPTGTGKTITQAAMAKATGQRTLILCLTEQIKKAWYADLRLAFGLAPQDIGLIQQKTFRIGEHFTLASVKTLIKRRVHWPDLFKKIGCLIVDEAHTVSAPIVHDFVFECPSKYVIGATATPPRGKKSFWFYAAFGVVRSRIVSSQKDTETSVSLKEVVKVPTAFYYKADADMIDWHDLTEQMMADEARNELAVRNIVKDYKAGESVLVYTRRLAHVDVLVDMLREAGIEDANKITGETNADRDYTDKVYEGVLSRKIRCVVATDAVKLGANLNPLSVLHLVTPMAQGHNLEQLIGRIRRQSPGKKTCRIMYYYDLNVPYLKRLFSKVAVPVFRRLKVPDYVSYYEC